MVEVVPVALGTAGATGSGDRDARAPWAAPSAESASSDTDAERWAAPRRSGDIDPATLQTLRRRARARIASDYRHVIANWAAASATGTRQTSRGALVGLMYALADKDPGTCDHSARVARLATDITMRLWPDDHDLADCVRVAALLHDIGKLEIPEAVLNKRGELSEDEMALIREHPRIGANTLEPLIDANTVAMVLSHHEHVNGRGYPNQLAGTDIPLGARIIAVVDAYDAMTSDRPYRDEMARHEVLGILRSGAGSQWDREIVDALLNLLDERADREAPLPAA